MIDQVKVKNNPESLAKDTLKEKEKGKDYEIKQDLGVNYFSVTSPMSSPRNE